MELQSLNAPVDTAPTPPIRLCPGLRGSRPRVRFRYDRSRTYPSGVSPRSTRRCCAGRSRRLSGDCAARIVSSVSTPAQTSPAARPSRALHTGRLIGDDTVSVAACLRLCGRRPSRVSRVSADAAWRTSAALRHHRRSRVPLESLAIGDAGDHLRFIADVDVHGRVFEVRQNPPALLDFLRCQ